MAAPDALNGDFLELNDFMHDVEEEVIQVVGQNPSFDLNNLPVNQENVPPANQEQFQFAEEMQFSHLPIEPMIDDEIPLHMLMDGNELDQEEDQEVDQQMDNAANNILNAGTALIRGESLADPVFFAKVEQFQR